MKTIRITLLTLAGLTATAGLHASPLLECRDDQLQTMTAESLRDQLSAAGARNCEVRSASWGESVACQGTAPGTRAFGVAARELSAEIQRESGKRTIQVVTTTSVAAAERAADPTAAAPNLTVTVEPEESGVTVVSCIAQGPATDADTGAALAVREPGESSSF